MIRKSKYRAKPTTVDGIRFASKAEAIRYNVLKARELAGQLSKLELQPAYEIFLNGRKICKVRLDFRYIKDGCEVIEDVKGFDNPLSRLKRALVEAAHGIKVIIIHTNEVSGE